MPDPPQESDAAGADDEAPPVVPPVSVNLSKELPFLVTHWLSGYGTNRIDSHLGGENQEAFATIRRAASELAGAFSAIGAFGTASRPNLGTQQSILAQSASQNATFADMKRQWSKTPHDRLNHIVGAGVAVGLAADSTARDASMLNLCQASAEEIQKQRDNPDSGRTLQEAIVVDDTQVQATLQAPQIASVLQPPAVFGRSVVDKKTKTEETAILETRPDRSGKLSISAESKFFQLSSSAARSVRSFLQLRDNVRRQNAQLQSIRRSLDLQNKALHDVERDLGLAERNAGMDAASKFAAMDELEQSKQNCSRVIAQLQRQLAPLTDSHAADSVRLASAEAEARSAFARARDVVQSYRDPFGNVGTRSGFSGNRILCNLTSRQLGFDRIGGRNIPRSMGRIRAVPTALEARKALVYNRFSHAATIDCHREYPIYCLRFDRTGRYFITGADDFLMKVFCIGAYAYGKRSMDAASYARGAVLVCTLRGHAGVINDIGVSPDNCFLATASEDGDCRIWGLKDGCPVAILRGHEGGATMVAWSTLTPYRLVTTGSDGLARTWDIREACLKRYGGQVGKRPEYRLQLTEEERRATTQREEQSSSLAQASANAVSLPPLPERQEQEDPTTETSLQPQGAPPIPLPPLPPGQAGEQNAAVLDQIDSIEAGRFVANDLIDEGVKLLSKLQHGTQLDEQMGVPGTRSRRSRVKVICVARCPHGGHFATGSDDGICRVWQDDEDKAVELVDGRHSSTILDFDNDGISGRSRRFSQRPSERLLLQLKGHLSSITDLQYSHAGDRILTASQKDGVVRLWSWIFDPAAASASPSGNRHRSHILIKLTNPNSSPGSVAASQSTRRRPSRNRASNSMVSCDVAVWVHDDTKIITSQSELSKQNSSDVIAGSQFIFLWDSFSGSCLLGIAEAHTTQCPVILPHPADSSIMCSAGLDGIVKIWDWETGLCIFNHENTVEFGQGDANQRDKIRGYLDGAFNHDGTSLVLTDDSGRVTLFDSLSPRESSSHRDREGPPLWMTEQYFSNDYYEVFYDSNGYCVERGSEQPPHLAPRGARCSQNGQAWSDEVKEAFKGLVGPQPCLQDEARWHRQLVRSNGRAARERRVSLPGNLVSQFDPQTTKLIRSNGQIATIQSVSLATSAVPGRSEVARQNSASRSSPGLSSNWRWGDYEDLIRERPIDDEEPESDDEEFELNEGRGRRLAEPADAESVSEDEDLGLMDAEPQNVIESEFLPDTETATRSSSRNRRSKYVAEDESDEDVVEMMSTNNTPSGPFVADYEAHFFRVPKPEDVIRRWLCRVESNSSYGGRKSYTPQVADEVVYIPRAHYETINQFPSLVAPWQSWPEEAAWPVVRCCIRNVRLRFPYKAYFGRNNTGLSCCSLVAILTLEVTGIPKLSRYRRLAWPKPAFIAPTKKHTFELSVFENDLAEFIIPYGLYVARLSQLEDALRHADAHPEIEVLYAGQPDESDETEDTDRELIPWPGRVESHSDRSFDINHPSLSGSGYCAVPIRWEDGTTNGQSPWEINVISSASRSPPNRPSLSESEKKTIRDALNVIKGIPSVKDFFLSPVDERRFSDYSSRIEVPMNLSFISNRLEADYYGTMLGVAADVRLIRDNCIKYNSENHELSAVARTMLDRFEELVLTESERISFHEFDAPMVENIPQREPVIQDGAETTENTENTGPVATRRTRVHSGLVHTRTSLENLPSPPETRTRGQTRQLADQSNRRSSQTRRRNASSRTTRSSRSVLERSPDFYGQGPQVQRERTTMTSRNSQQRSGRPRTSTSNLHQIGQVGGRGRRRGRPASQGHLRSQQLPSPDVRAARARRVARAADRSEESVDGHELSQQPNRATTVRSTRATRVADRVEESVDNHELSQQPNLALRSTGRAGSNRETHPSAVEPASPRRSTRSLRSQSFKLTVSVGGEPVRRSFLGQNPRDAIMLSGDGDSKVDAEGEAGKPSERGDLPSDSNESSDSESAVSEKLPRHSKRRLAKTDSSAEEFKSEDGLFSPSESEDSVRHVRRKSRSAKPLVASRRRRPHGRASPKSDPSSSNESESPQPVRRSGRRRKAVKKNSPDEDEYDDSEDDPGRSAKPLVASRHRQPYGRASPKSDSSTFNESESPKPVRRSGRRSAVEKNSTDEDESDGSEDDPGRSAKPLVASRHRRPYDIASPKYDSSSSNESESPKPVRLSGRRNAVKNNSPDEDESDDSEDDPGHEKHTARRSTRRGREERKKSSGEDRSSNSEDDQENECPSGFESSHADRSVKSSDGSDDSCGSEKAIAGEDGSEDSENDQGHESGSDFGEKQRARGSAGVSASSGGRKNSFEENDNSEDDQDHDESDDSDNDSDQVHNFPSGTEKTQGCRRSARRAAKKHLTGEDGSDDSEEGHGKQHAHRSVRTSAGRKNLPGDSDGDQGHEKLPNRHKSNGVQRGSLTRGSQKPDSKSSSSTRRRGRPRKHTGSIDGVKAKASSANRRRSSSRRVSGKAAQSSRKRAWDALGTEDEPTPRRACRKNEAISYVDPDSSEFGTDFDGISASEDDTNEKLNFKRKKRNDRSVPSKKRKTKREIPRVDIPEQEDWPEIDIQDITEVSTKVLNRLREIDADDVFAFPVEESNPDIFEHYKSVIECPMDFRTIEEERLQRYQSIKELQQDLILVFSNGMQFNKPRSPIYGLAEVMLESMGDIFRRTCKDLRIRGARAWA